MSKAAFRKILFYETGPAEVLKIVEVPTPAFERIVDAHRYLESNEQFGKAVVTI